MFDSNTPLPASGGNFKKQREYLLKFKETQFQDYLIASEKYFE